MDLDSRKIFKTLNPNKIWIPVAIGLSIVFYQFYSDENFTLESLLLVRDARPAMMFIALLVLLARDAGYVYRIRTITGQELSWISSIYVIILWEFSSAVTPSVVGGTAVAVFILWKEGLKLGKALSYVMVTAIFDNMFFVVAAPIALWLGGEVIFPKVDTSTALGKSLESLFFLSYLLIAIYTFVMAFAIFIRPRLFKWFLIKITSIGFLRRWRYAAYERSNEIMMASQLIKGKKFDYWLKLAVSTIFIWSARYFLVNVLIAGYNEGLSWYDHVIIFGKHIILWIVMLVSPTPGSSGLADYFFPLFFGEYLDKYAYVVSILWRLVTYYPYLILGAIFLPRWIKRVFFKKKPVEEVA